MKTRILEFDVHCISLVVRVFSVLNERLQEEKSICKNMIIIYKKPIYLDICTIVDVTVEGFVETPDASPILAAGRTAM